MGTRTELKPALAMASKYSFLSETPHSPSFGASSALPKFTPRLISLQSAKISFLSAADADDIAATHRNGVISVRILLMMRFAVQHVTAENQTQNGNQPAISPDQGAYAPRSPVQFEICTFQFAIS